MSAIEGEDPGTYDEDEDHTASDYGDVEVSDEEEQRLYQETLQGLNEAGF